MNWINVNDALPPEKGDDFLVCDEIGACWVAMYKGNGLWDFHGAKFWESADVTHWMPLPKRPFKL